MSFSQLDVALRAGAAGVVLLQAWLLLRDRRRIGLPALLFPPLALCLAGFVVGNTPIATLRPAGWPGLLAHALSGFTVVFLWWFCLSCFDSRFGLRGGVLYTGLAWAGIAALDRGLLGGAFAGVEFSLFLVPLGLAIVGHLIWRLLAERPGDLIQQRHDARIMVVILLGGMLSIDLAADLLFGSAWRPLAFAMFQNAMILAFGLWLAGKLLIVRVEALTFGLAPDVMPRDRATAQPDGRSDEILYRRLCVLMETDRIFVDPELTFAAFVERMGASERAVRALVNHALGHDHFRAFLNHYRVAEARRLLGDPARADKLIAVALDSGFSSLASFNRVFRAIEGCTPSEYRATARGRAIAFGFPALNDPPRNGEGDHPKGGGGDFFHKSRPSTVLTDGPPPLKGRDE